jgi:SAM-dependent methyltransferase
MHKKVLESCKRFCIDYLNPEEKLSVLDVGSYDVNGCFKPLFEKLGKGNWHYDGLDIKEGPNVDIISKEGKFPIEDNAYDAVVSSSCFEHDAAFWITFKEIVRVTKNNGYIQISTPSTGAVHRYPLDCWRFYPDAYTALSKWCPEAELIESYNVGGGFNDLVGIFKMQKTVTLWETNDPYFQNLQTTKKKNERTRRRFISSGNGEAGGRED